jgi:anti-anti-sigma factor
MEFYYHGTEDDVLIIAADGGIDRQTGEEFVDGICDIIEGGVQKVIVDCSRLKYISSYGLGLLLRVHKRAREAGGEVKLADLHGRVFDVLEIMRLDHVFAIYSEVDAALSDFSSGN